MLVVHTAIRSGHHKQPLRNPFVSLRELGRRKATRGGLATPPLSFFYPGPRAFCSSWKSALGENVWDSEPQVHGWGGDQPGAVTRTLPLPGPEDLQRQQPQHGGLPAPFCVLVTVQQGHYPVLSISYPKFFIFGAFKTSLASTQEQTFRVFTVLPSCGPERKLLHSVAFSVWHPSVLVWGPCPFFFSSVICMTESSCVQTELCLGKWLWPIRKIVYCKMWVKSYKTLCDRTAAMCWQLTTCQAWVHTLCMLTTLICPKSLLRREVLSLCHSQMTSPWLVRSHSFFRSHSKRHTKVETQVSFELRSCYYVAQANLKLTD